MSERREREGALSIGVHTTVVLAMVDWNSSDKVLSAGLACLRKSLGLEVHQRRKWEAEAALANFQVMERIVAFS